MKKSKYYDHDDDLIDKVFEVLKEGHEIIVEDYLKSKKTEAIKIKRVLQVINKYKQTNPNSLTDELNTDGRELILIHGSYKNFLSNQRKKNRIPILTRIATLSTIISVSYNVMQGVKNDKKDEIINKQSNAIDSIKTIVAIREKESLFWKSKYDSLFNIKQIVKTEPKHSSQYTYRFSGSNGKTEYYLPNLIGIDIDIIFFGNVVLEQSQYAFNKKNGKLIFRDNPFVITDDLEIAITYH